MMIHRSWSLSSWLRRADRPVLLLMFKAQRQERLRRDAVELI
jgi:hypothetical protein